MTDMTEILCKAIQQNQCVEMTYDGHERLVEVHAVGRHSSTRNLLARVYQVSGGSNSGNNTGWKLMIVDDIMDCEISSQESEAPRPDYRADDSHLQGRIICNV